MELNKIFIRYRDPEQVIYFGDRTIDLFRIKKGNPRKINSFERDSGERIFPVELKRDLISTGTGIVLNSDNFVFNMLNFDKIPFRKKQKNDLVNWRVEKIFPENIHNYIHEFFQFDSNTILSVLVKNELIASLEAEIRSLGANLIYSGNSTIEIINSMKNTKKNPDFFIEADGRIMLAVFFKEGIPVYIRKMRSGRGADKGDEILRTVDYVEKNYGFRPISCSVFAKDEEGESIRTSLKDLKFRVIVQERSDMRFLPGVK